MGDDVVLPVVDIWTDGSALKASNGRFYCGAGIVLVYGEKVMNKTIYRYTDDSWWDGHEDCPCCSGLLFETYNADGWSQNGSASDKWELCKDVLAAHKYDSEGGVDFIEWSAIISAAYEGLTLEELESLCARLGVVLEEV